MEKEGSFSPEYIKFWVDRGILNLSEYAGGKRPDTEEEVAVARERTTKLLGLLHDPDYGTVRDHLASLFMHWIRGGLITPEQHMELVSTYEKITKGETTEEFLAKLHAPESS